MVSAVVAVVGAARNKSFLAKQSFCHLTAFTQTFRLVCCAYHVKWHQDYGYWYSTELYPNMASCMVAVDCAHEYNGALNVLKGSHKLGRLDHAREATAGEVRRASPSLLPHPPVLASLCL